MNRLQLFREILATYRKHGWRLARALMRAETLDELRGESDGGDDTAGGDAAAVELRFEGVETRASGFDAVWMTRPSHAGREAWELRLVAETPYALFELFEPDEEEEDREDVRREMEARLAEYLSPSGERGQ